MTDPKTTYDSSKYSVRGEGMQDWQKAGKPPYDCNDKELDNTGWPTGKMKDGSSTSSQPVNTDFAVSHVYVTLADEHDTATLESNIEAGSYWLASGEQPDQLWTLSQNGVQVASGSGSSDEGRPFTLAKGPVSLHASFAADAVPPEVLAERKAAGQGVSKTHYQLRKT